MTNNDPSEETREYDDEGRWYRIKNGKWFMLRIEESWRPIETKFVPKSILGEEKNDQQPRHHHSP